MSPATGTAAGTLAERLREELKQDELTEEAFRQRCVKAALSDWRIFVTDVLGYQLRDFHEDWFRHQDENQQTLLLAPRGHGKSTICNAAFVLWRLVNNRNLRILIVSKTGRQAELFLDEIKQHMEKNPVFRYLFGDWVQGDEWTTVQIRIPRDLIAKEPTITAFGVGGSLPTWHFDLIIADDLHDLWNSRTPGQRQVVWDWLQSTVVPTLMPNGELHIIGTRWHPDDVYGRLEAISEDAETEDGYVVWKAVAVIDDDTQTVLWPEEYPYELLMRIKRQQGPSIFSMQYQQDASSVLVTGMIFNADDFIIIDPHEVARLKQTAITSACYWDLATGEREKVATRYGSQEGGKTHYTACVGAFVTKDMNIVIEYWWRGKPGLSEQIAKIKRTQREFEWDEIGVEAVAYQSVLAKHLMATTLYPIRPTQRDRDKIRMAWACQPYVAEGRVMLSQRALGLRDLLVEFPDGEEDDSVDAFTGLMQRLMKRVRAMEIKDEWQKRGEVEGIG